MVMYEWLVFANINFKFIQIQSDLKDKKLELLSNNNMYRAQIEWTARTR